MLITTWTKSDDPAGERKMPSHADQIYDHRKPQWPPHVVGRTTSGCFRPASWFDGKVGIGWSVCHYVEFFPLFVSIYLTPFSCSWQCDFVVTYLSNLTYSHWLGIVISTCWLCNFSSICEFWITKNVWLIAMYPMLVYTFDWPCIHLNFLTFTSTITISVHTCIINLLHRHDGFFIKAIFE